MLEIVSYGAVPDGSDCTPALNAAIADALAGDQKQIHVPAGQWTFRTPPQPLSAGVGLVGEGKSTTILTRAYSGGEFLVIYNQGTILRDFTIWAGPGTSGGIAIHAVSDDAPHGAGGNHLFQNLWVTSGSGGTW